jgi:hypothetical protein
MTWGMELRIVYSVRLLPRLLLPRSPPRIELRTVNSVRLLPLLLLPRSPPRLLQLDLVDRLSS